MSNDKRQPIPHITSEQLRKRVSSIVREPTDGSIVETEIVEVYFSSADGSDTFKHTIYIAPYSAYANYTDDQFADVAIKHVYGVLNDTIDKLNWLMES